MIVLYKGARGRGKTLTMVKDAYKFYLEGYKIYSNIKISFGESIAKDEILNLNKDSDLHDCVLIIDELMLIFDSRNFSTKKNKDFSYFIAQIRKRNIIILGTTQYTGGVELRFRQNIDVIAVPKFDVNTNICLCYYYDITLLEDGLDPSCLIPSLVVYDGKQIFRLYNTNEFIV